MSEPSSATVLAPTETAASYGARLHAAMAARGPLCVGIDPHPPGCCVPGACPTTPTAWNGSP